MVEGQHRYREREERDFPPTEYQCGFTPYRDVGAKSCSYSKVHTLITNTNAGGKEGESDFMYMKL